MKRFAQEDTAAMATPESERVEATDSDRLMDIRRRWYEAHVRRFEKDREAVDEPARRRSSDRTSTGSGSAADKEFLDYITGPYSANRSELTRDLDPDPDRFMAVADWWKTTRPAILDPALVDLCAFGDDVDDAVKEPIIEAAKEKFWPRRSSDATVTHAALHANARALLAIARYLGDAVLKDVAALTGLPDLYVKLPPRNWGGWGAKRPRADVWVDWRIPFATRVVYHLPCLRLWVNHDGAAIGIVPGGFKEVEKNARAVFDSVRLDGFRLGAVTRSQTGFLFGRWYSPDQLIDLDVRVECREIAVAAQPLLGDLIEMARNLESVVATTPAGAAVATVQDKAVDPLDARLARAAAALLIDVEFLRDIVALLEDKRQVIFYGPPGTGKTYLARALAQAVAPDHACRSLVQFHPATSYEDFFEGYRPVKSTEDGRVAYELVPGPLARMVKKAEKAESANTSEEAGTAGAAARADEPGGTVDAAEQAGQAEDNRHAAARHVMVIDEINRANLPKVLGELLFLLEYRDERTPTLYRPEAEFKLPGNLWFIGTMNTADRSIALVDAALRRRFHFVPFFPDHGPMAGLLGRWLAANGEPAWVGRLVAMVNAELTEAIGGSHLQLGASHFMKRGLDRNTLRRIWQYNVEPFIEDQLFGDAERIARFRFDEVYARWQAEHGGTAEESDPPGDRAADTVNQSDDELPHERAG